MKLSVRMCCVVVVAAIVSTTGLATSHAGVIYVNNQSGDDTFDGRAEKPVSGRTGPVRTLSRALQRVKPTDRISIANTGEPYHGSLELTGSKFSGVGKDNPFILDGNGATLSGTKPVPPWAWRRHADGIVEMRPQRKGHYLLLKDGKPLPLQAAKERAAIKPLKKGEWTYRAGSMFYRLRDGETLRDGRYEFAAEGIGISLYDVRNVVIKNLTLKHYRVDGIHAHGLCKNVVTDNVTCIGNVRSGIAVSGTSNMQIYNCTFEKSRQHSVRVSGYANGRIDQTKLDKPVTLR